MRKISRKIGNINTLLALIILLPWIIVLGASGLPPIYAWFLLKLVMPFIGSAGMLVSLVMIAITLSKRKQVAGRIITFALCTVMALHLLLTLNIIPMPYPAQVDRTKPAVTVAWPLAGPTVVGWGGNSTHTNLPHVIWPSERWAYDLLMEPYSTGSRNFEDYGIWNQEVLAPVSGTVIAAYDAEPDIVPGSEDILSMEGNHVYLKIDETGTYLLLNHLRQNSVAVQVGDHVEPGDVLGRVGNSGSSSEPHLHIHHQRQNPLSTPHPILAEGLPLYFTGIDSEPMPEKGAIVHPLH
ncbi:M23 family metallopeptidase [Paenibacillus sp. D2_2]|uniref:M23 family metallopeptidase n=1 Tax=Paenibacillus sp. D2_2 TaxID=3073092 RepID=UPI002815170D|nr:M23 family metallopeptidase [Paenibacillus sp. D2_2]WMT39042.1 M23 family metallopeptidase [Paenibacillus sp. D2_2]